MKKRNTPEEFATLTEPMLSLAVSNTWRGYGTAIFVEFGKLHQPPKANNSKGEFCLDLQWCWQFEKQRSIWFGSDSRDNRVSNQLRKLKGMRAEGIALFGRMPEIQLNLENRCWATSFAAEETKPEWALLLPDRSWCHVANGVLYHESTPSRTSACTTDRAQARGVR